MSDEKPMGQVIQIDEAGIRDHLGEMVRVRSWTAVLDCMGAMAKATAHRCKRDMAWSEDAA